MKSHTDLIKGIIRDLTKVDLVLMFEKTNEKDSEEEALLCELKSATDNLRTSMWCRMRASETEENGSREMIEYHRKKRVAELVRQYPYYAREAFVAEDSVVNKFEDMAQMALEDHLATPATQVN